MCVCVWGWGGRWPRAEGAGKVQEIDEPIIFHQPGLNLKSNENILAAKSSPHTNRERRYRQNGWNALKGKSFLSSWCRKTITIKSQVCPWVSVITWDRSSPGLICYSDDENWAEKNMNMPLQTQSCTLLENIRVNQKTFIKKISIDISVQMYLIC